MVLALSSLGVVDLQPEHATRFAGHYRAGPTWIMDSSHEGRHTGDLVCRGAIGFLGRREADLQSKAIEEPLEYLQAMVFALVRRTGV